MGTPAIKMHFKSLKTTSLNYTLQAHFQASTTTEFKPKKRWRTAFNRQILKNNIQECLMFLLLAKE